MTNIVTLIFVIIFYLVQGNVIETEFNKIGDNAVYDRVDVKPNIVSDRKCADLCLQKADCDGIQYMRNKTCLFLTNIVEQTVINPIVSTYVRKGRLHIVSTLNLFISLNTLLI